MHLFLVGVLGAQGCLWCKPSCRIHSFLMGSPSGKFLKGFAKGKRTDSQGTSSAEKGVHLGPWFQTSFISTGFYRHHSNPSQRKVRSRFRFGIPFSPKCSHKLFGPWWVWSGREQGLPGGGGGWWPTAQHRLGPWGGSSAAAPWWAGGEACWIVSVYALQLGVLHLSQLLWAQIPATRLLG